MRNERFKNILKINWFIHSWIEYNRDDWMQIIHNHHLSEYEVINTIWDVVTLDNKDELIWYLALNWIINRLF